MADVNLVYLITTVAGGGGGAAAITAFFQNKKVKAEANSLNAKTRPEVESLTVGTMGEVIDNLREDNASLRAERDGYKAQLLEMEKQINTMREELERLHVRIAEMLKEPPPPIINIDPS